MIGVLLYPIFGTSPHLITGPTAVMSILVSGLIPTAPFHNPSYEVNGTMFPINSGPNACNDENSVDCNVRIALLLCLSFLSGLMQALLGLGKLGFLVDLISEPVIIGFTTGSAFLIAGTQITNFLSIPKCGDKGAAPCWSDLGFVDTVANIFEEWDVIDPATVGYGCVCLALLFFFQDGWNKLVKRYHLSNRLQFLSRLGPLIVLVASVVLMVTTNGDAKTKQNEWGVKIVGTVCVETHKGIHPECFPPFSVPMAFAENDYVIRLGDLIMLLGPAFTVALVGFMEAISIAKTVATQVARSTGKDVKIEPNSEFFALGVCNLLCSFFSGYPVTGSFARTAVNAACQAQSPMSALIATAFAATTLLFLTPLLAFIPKVALASIVLVAVIKLIHIREAIFLWRVCKRDFVSFITIVIATLILGVQAALILGILVSWILFLGQNHPADAFILTRPDASLSSGVADLTNCVDFMDLDREQTFSDHVVVLRLYGDLRFATAGYFKRLVEQIVTSTHPLAIVVDCTTVINVDSSGVHVLRSIAESLSNKKICFFLAALPARSLRVLQAAYLNTAALRKRNAWDVTVQTEVSRHTPRSALEIFSALELAVQTAWEAGQANSSEYGATNNRTPLTATHVAKTWKKGEKMQLIRAQFIPAEAAEGV